jgi:integration host factor subunit beta
MLDKNTFVKSDIVKDLQGHFQAIPNNNVEKIVESIFKYLGNALAEGRNIEIRGLGTFKIKKMPARNARNPKTGESIMIEEKNKLKWKSSKLLNFRINKKDNIEK